MKKVRIAVDGVGLVEVDPAAGTLMPTNEKMAERLGLKGLPTALEDAQDARHKAVQAASRRYGLPEAGWLWIPL